ncbi:MAG: FtsQ-type POTRA domain-containing protein [Acidimicrobiales bacterium]
MADEKKPRATTDLRIAARRVDVRREQGRRRLRIIGALTALSLVVILVIALTNSPLLDVDDIVVTGTDRTAPDEVLGSLSMQVGDPLASLDLSKAQQEVEALPWVHTVEVSRSWLGTITVSVVERTPRIAVAAPGGFALVDDAGRQLEIVPVQPVEFVPVAGVSASGVIGDPAPVEIQSVLLLLDALDAATATEVAQIVVDDRRLYIELASGGRISLGDDAGLVEKLTSARTILDQVDVRCLWEIDVRVPTAPAVTRISADGIPGASLTDLSNCS